MDRAGRVRRRRSPSSIYLPTFLDDPTRTRQWAEYLCYAALAVGIDIAWGYGGMLVLGQGLFFGLGAYAMGMHLTLEQVGPGRAAELHVAVRRPDELPLIWRPFEHLWVSVVLALLIPMVLAGAFGWLVFSRRVRGPYFALLSQAMALIFTLIMVGQLKTFAGTNGLTDFQTVFGRNKYDPDTNTFLYFVAAGVLSSCSSSPATSSEPLRAAARRRARPRGPGALPRLQPGRRQDVRLRRRRRHGRGGRGVAAPIIGIVAPNQFGTLPSILMVCWVAVGGRGTLYGAIIGAILVNWGATSVSEQWPDTWQYVQGLLFIVVVAFIPGGLVGLFKLDRATPAEPAPAPTRCRRVIPPPVDPLAEAAT